MGKPGWPVKGFGLTQQALHPGALLHRHADMENGMENSALGGEVCGACKELVVQGLIVWFTLHTSMQLPSILCFTGTAK